MSFSAQKATPFEVTNEALNKIVNLKTNEGAKFFRVYVKKRFRSGEMATYSLIFAH